MGNNSSISNEDSLDNTAQLDRPVQKPTLKFTAKVNLTDLRMTVSNFVPADGVGYVGNLDKSGQKHGVGRFIYENGDEYEGEWVNDKKHGKGIYRMVNGDVFEGEFKDGQRCGRGTYKYATGALYSGEFRNNKMHGHGTYVYNSGAKYIGSFAVDKMHGEGALYFLDGTSYRGFWINGIADKTSQSDDEVVGGFQQDKSLYFSSHNHENNTVSPENVLHRSRSLFSPAKNNGSRSHEHEHNNDNDDDDDNVVAIEVHRSSQSDRKAAKVRNGGNKAYNSSNNINRVQVISLSKGDDGSDEEKEIFEKTLARSPYNYPKQSTSPLKLEDYDDTNSSSMQTFSMSDVYSKSKSQNSHEYYELDRSRISVSFINLDKINNRREEIVEMAESSKSTNKAAGKGKLPISNATTSEPGKGAAAVLKPKKAAAHRQVIEDAANYNQQSDSSPQLASNGGDEYESGKVQKNKKSSRDEDVDAVKALDRWDI